MPCTTTTPMTIPRRQTTADQMRPERPTRFFLLFEQCSGCGSDLSNHATKTVRVMIKGRVQGVFYRNWTVGEMEQRCRRGPPDAMVTGFQVFPSTDDPGTGFQRKATV
ncbi:hypothetical protein POTOM_025443 [Populus tomentosa]|uniref:Acylphosphatase n=1 Tax=Populus tomentosa TaxID=118781 RepID=A0A8X7ZIM9_POPTO|nr:hypothetical protein POTOM_025443 [Populus tomentosa]